MTLTGLSSAGGENAGEPHVAAPLLAARVGRLAHIIRVISIAFEIAIEIDHE